MSAINFVQNNPDFFNQELIQQGAWNRISEQAKQHTRYDSTALNIRKSRPNESETIKEYREDNHRRMTKSVVDKFKTKTSRIFRSSGMSINQETLSRSLSGYLESKPYTYLNQPTDLITYFFDYVYNQSIDDPNAVEILLPYNPMNPEVSPLADEADGGLPKNVFVPIKKIIVPHSGIRAFSSEIFSWYGGEMNLENGSNKDEYYSWFWIVDKEYFYKYIPVSKDQRTHEINYRLDVWYFHDTGIGNQKVLPVNVLIGNLVFGDDGSYAYQSSILGAFFEYADEFDSRFSDGQAVWITGAFPIHIMEEMACTADGCFQGKIRNPDLKSSQKTIRCGECDGTGYLQRPSPYGVLIRKDKTSVEGSGSSGKPYELINPDTSTLQTTYDIPFDLLKKGEKQIGLDVLENAIESGVSRAMRFEDVKDKLSEIASKLVSFLELHLFFTECLLVPNRSQRKIPKVNTPMDFQLKSAVDLKEDVEKALPSDRLEKTLTYYRNIYKNNDRLIKVYELAFKYSPSLMNTWEEVKDMMLMGVLDENDVVKREHVVSELRDISIDPNFMSLTEERVFSMLDERFKSKDLLIPESLIITDDNGNVEPQNDG